jgi:hypothetical protein
MASGEGKERNNAVYLSFEEEEGIKSRGSSTGGKGGA